MNCANTGIAADVALARSVQRLGVELADHEPQIQVAVGDRLDVAAAHGAEITFFALGHGPDLSGNSTPRHRELDRDDDTKSRIF